MSTCHPSTTLSSVPTYHDDWTCITLPSSQVKYIYIIQQGQEKYEMLIHVQSHLDIDNHAMLREADINGWLVVRRSRVSSHEKLAFILT